MYYLTATPTEQKHLRNYVESMLTRLWAYREGKENFAIAAVVLFLGAAATALISKDWPPEFAKGRILTTQVAFLILWLLFAVYIRYQLRLRRWAALRVAGCEWLLAEWLPDSPRALSQKGQAPVVREPSDLLILVDILKPMKDAVAVLDPKVNVYPAEIVHAWLWAQHRGTNAFRHECIIHLVGWLACLAVILRALFK